MALCNARQRRCKGCDRRYTAEETKAGVMACPDCGRERGHCGAQAVTGMEKCRHHGGKSLKGIAAPSWRGGVTSKHMPTRMLAAYQAAMDDPDYLSLRNEMGVIFSLMTDTLKQIDSGASGDKWKELKKAIRLYREAKDTDERMTRFDAIEKIVFDGIVDFNARMTVMKAAGEYRKMHDSVVKRQTAASGMFTGEQVLGLLMTLVLGVKNIVQDRKQLNAIADLYDRIVAQTSGAPVAERRDDTGSDESDLNSRAIPAEIVSGDPGLQRQEA